MNQRVKSKTNNCYVCRKIEKEKETELKDGKKLECTELDNLKIQNTTQIKIKT